MADAPAKAPEGKSAFGFLGKKVFGKIPVWVIAVAAVGGYYWYSHRKGAGAAQQTDPAGNTCSAVNPATGYCPGTPEDLAAQQSNAGTDTTGSGTGMSGSGTDQSGGAAGGTGDGSTGTSGGTGGADTGPLLTWTDQSGQTQTGTASDFQDAFAATGTNAGQVVPGGTGQPVPLPTGQSYTDAGPSLRPPSPAAKPGAQNAHNQHLAHVAHVQHLRHVAATRRQPARTPRG